jgi:signal peptidase I
MKQLKGMKTIYYVGGSMNPLLRNLDMLFYSPYGDRDIKPGDVVVINAPAGKTVIHRVVSASKNGITTMGDNTRSLDSWTLKPEQVEGKVVYAVRGTKQFAVHGGLIGRIYAETIQFSNRAANLLCSAASPNIIPASRSIEKLITPRLRLLMFQKPEGIELQLICWKYSVGKRKFGDRWRIRMPFRLFLREQSIKELLCWSQQNSADHD